MDNHRGPDASITRDTAEYDVEVGRLAFADGVREPEGVSIEDGGGVDREAVFAEPEVRVEGQDGHTVLRARVRGRDRDVVASVTGRVDGNSIDNNDIRRRSGIRASAVVVTAS